jgi:hypothetical protein
MVITRNNSRSGHLDIDDYKFERVDNFKKLGVDINKEANSHNEINIRLAAANRCYFGLVPLFKLKILSWKSKIILYKVLVRPVVLYAYSTWATTKSDELKFAIFERKILKRWTQKEQRR